MKYNVKGTIRKKGPKGRTMWTRDFDFTFEDDNVDNLLEAVDEVMLDQK